MGLDIVFEQSSWYCQERNGRTARFFFSPRKDAKCKGRAVPVPAFSIQSLSEKDVSIRKSM